MPRYLLILSYDGTDFHGWQSQTGDRTVQDTLETALHELFEPGIRATAAGRTDAGVHAEAMPVSFDAEKGRDPETVVRALRGMLPPDVQVRAARVVPGDFSARFSARSRSYRYTVEHGGFRDPLTRRFAWQLPVELDARSVHDAMPSLVGEHDFGAFRAAGCTAKSPVRRMLRADFRPDGRRWTFTFEADGFLRGMVRSLVGTLVEVGQGKRPPDDVRRLLASPSRSEAGVTAPAAGLTFLFARYEDASCDVGWWESRLS